MKLFASVLVIGVAIGEIFFIRLHPINTVLLGDLNYLAPPNFIVVLDEQRENSSGIVFIRPKDGREQFIHGNWNVDFSTDGAYTYGKNSSGYTLYNLSADGRIYDIRISNIQGSIVSVQENPKSTYLFIEVSDQKKTTYCIAERTTEEALACKQLGVGSIAQGRWNPNKDHELVIKTDKEELFTFDPWEEAPHSIDRQSDTAAYNRLAELFQEKKPVQRMWQFFNILAVHSKAGWTIHRVPWNSTVRPFTDIRHVLIQQPNALSILELSTNKKAPLLQEKGIGSKSILATSSWE